MSLKNSNTKSDYLEWNEGINLIPKLERDSNDQFAIIIAGGMFLGLRISDLKTLRWCDIINQDSIALNEKKTGKRRILKINSQVADIAKRIYSKQPLTERMINEPICKVSTQYINRIMKEIKIQYRLKIDHFSTHSLRKTFGRRIWEQDNHSEKALILLSEIFNHSGTNITRKYLGIRQEEIANVYELL